jgi:hypothetical protein
MPTAMFMSTINSPNPVAEEKHGNKNGSQQDQHPVISDPFHFYLLSLSVELIIALSCITNKRWYCFPFTGV